MSSLLITRERISLRTRKGATQSIRFWVCLSVSYLRYSYKYVELSIRNRQREDLKDHAAGPPAGTIRSVGSTTMPAKGTRNYYSTEDDRVLWDWVIKHEHKNGYISGNEIYKQLEEVVRPKLNAGRTGL